MEWYILSSLVGLAIGIGIIIYKIRSKEDNGLDLDSRLNVIKSRWDDVCKKIKNKMFGC